MLSFLLRSSNILRLPHLSNFSIDLALPGPSPPWFPWCFIPNLGKIVHSSANSPPSAASPPCSNMSQHHLSFYNSLSTQQHVQNTVIYQFHSRVPTLQQHVYNKPPEQLTAAFLLCNNMSKTKLPVHRTVASLSCNNMSKTAVCPPYSILSTLQQHAHSIAA
jgi:hypothetical protein